MPDARADDCTSSIIRVLPIPASPRMRIADPDVPPMQLSRTARNTAISERRPASGWASAVEVCVPVGRQTSIGKSRPLSLREPTELIGDHAAGRPIDGIRDKRFPAGRAREKPRGDIGGLARDGIATMAVAADRACDDFADGDADVDRKRSRHARLHIRKGGMNLKGGAHRAFGVIAVGDRRAEQRHRRVADVLVDCSAETVDDRVDQSEEALQQRVHLFRIEFRREARIANQIAKQNRYRPTVALGNGAARFGRRRAIAGEEPSATAAVPSAAFVGVTAFPTRRGQGRTAGRAEFALLAVLELAVLTTQFC